MNIPGTNILKTAWHSLLPLEKKMAVGLFVVLLVVRVFFLLRFPLHPDEVATFVLFMSKGVWRSMTYYPAPNNHILYSIFGNLLYFVTNNSFWVMRLPALLISTFSAPLILLILRRFTNFKTAFLATGFFCFSGLGMYYSFHGRGYFLLAVCSLLAAIGLWGFIRNNNRKALFVFCLGSVTGFYTVPTFLYPFISLLVWTTLVLLLNQEFRKWGQLTLAGFLVGVATVFLYLPVVFYNGLAALVGNEFVAPLARTDFFALFPGWFMQMQNQLVGREPNGYLLAVLFIGLLVGFAAREIWLKGKRAFKEAPLQWVLLLFCLEVLVITLVSIQGVLPPERVFIYLAVFQFAGLSWFIAHGLNTINLKKYSLPVMLVLLSGFAAHQVRALENFRKANLKIYAEMPGFIALALAQKPETMFIQHDYYNLFSQYAFLENNLKAQIDYIAYSPEKQYDLVVFRKEKAIPESVKKNYREIYRDNFIIAFKKR